VTTLSLITSQSLLDLHSAWKVALPWIKSALDRGGRFDPEDIEARVLCGTMQLWIAREGSEVKAVGVTEILYYPHIRVLSIVILTGEDRDMWLHHVSALEDYGRQHKCQRIESWARPGWKKILRDWSHTHSLLEKAL